MKTLKDCRYSVYISYAAADDQATDGWISQFSEQFRVRLQNRLGRIGGKQLQDMYLSGHNGPVMGSLTEELRARVAESYAMIIVVFDAYVRSAWGLQEVEYFRDSVGQDELRERLYVLALSKSAMGDIVARPDWARLMPRDQSWIPFYKDEDVDEPVQVQLEHGGLSERFDAQLSMLLDTFEAAVKQDLPQPPKAIARGHDDSSAAPHPGSSGVRGDAAVFCPAVVGLSTVFLVQVLLYPPDRASEARQQALEADAATQRRGVLALSPELPLGTRLDLHLEMPALRVDEPDAAFVWTGSTTAAQFDVAVPAEAAIGNAVGRVRFSVAGVPIGTLRFQFAVAADAPATAPRDALTEAKRYRRAFVSYSSSDRAEVLRRVQAFRIAGISVFQDVLDLEPAQRWERELYREIDRSDVVLLFWSAAAAASPWVAKEIDYALALKQGRDDLPPDIAPVPIEGPPIPPPPERLRHLHFNDALLAHISAAQVTPKR